jgi:hypothetical protein
MYRINNKGNWVALKKKIRLTYPTITEDDLKLNDDGEFDLLLKLQRRFSKTQSEIVQMIDRL